MIKFREKLFYRAEVMMWDFPVDEDGNPISFIIKIETSKRFKDGRKNCMTLDKARIKRYLTDLENILFITNNNISDDDTEYLDQLSDPRPGGRLVYSKKLSGNDRFCYIINYPIKIKDSDEYKIIIEVYSSIGHKRPDGGDYWSPDPIEMRKIRQEINQWRRKRGLQEI